MFLVAFCFLCSFFMHALGRHIPALLQGIVLSQPCLFLRTQSRAHTPSHARYRPCFAVRQYVIAGTYLLPRKVSSSLHHTACAFPFWIALLVCLVASLFDFVVTSLLPLDPSGSVLPMCFGLPVWIVASGVGLVLALP